MSHAAIVRAHGVGRSLLLRAMASSKQIRPFVAPGYRLPQVLTLF